MTVDAEVIMRLLVSLCVWLTCTTSSWAQGDPLAPWRAGFEVRDVAANPARHTIHSYYVCNPESPDGTRVVYFASTAANAHSGEVCVLDRQTCRETVIAQDIHTEDAHRAACQQWCSGGRRVAFHDVVDGRWNVSVVDLDTGKRRVLIQDHQLAFGNPASDEVPIYGCHWNPGEHRDLEMLNVETGAVRKVVTIKQVEQQYGEWLGREFGGKPTSIFFPVVSPDQRRVFFKMACGSGGTEFMSKAASQRQGLIAYDLVENRFLFLREKWGHPAWFPDSRYIMEMGNLYLDAEQNGSHTRVTHLPVLRGCHPAVSPDGRLFVQDGLSDALGGPVNEWCVTINDLRGGDGRYQLLHQFRQDRGARSWRGNHPHPVFSADGKRVYFNVSAGQWTRLLVAECAPVGTSN